MICDYKSQLLHRHVIAPRIYQLRFKLIDPSSLEFAPGQYLILVIGQVYRQFSILDYSADDQTFDLLIEHIKGGIASEYIAKLSVGDDVLFKGPAGIFVQREVVRPTIYFATGTGIAPIMPMIRSALEKNTSKPIFLYWGLSHKEDLYFERELDELQKKYSQFKCAICLSQENEKDAQPYFSGRIQKNIDAILPPEIKLADCDVYICGGREMVESIKEFAVTNSVPKSQLYFERFN